MGASCGQQLLLLHARTLRKWSDLVHLYPTYTGTTQGCVHRASCALHGSQGHWHCLLGNSSRQPGVATPCKTHVAAWYTLRCCCHMPCSAEALRKCWYCSSSQACM